MTTGLRPMGRVRNVLSVRPRGCTADEPQAEQQTVFSPGRWQSGWFLQRRLSECRCIPESRTHGTTSWWTCCVSNLNRVIDPTTDWASTSTFFKACTLPPDEPKKILCANRRLALPPDPFPGHASTGSTLGH